jgi:tRNA (uracil-5-)-methyltransferase TRM9
MDSDTAAKLIAINREFYDRFGASFSATRQHLQLGVKKILESVNGDENILDLGCGNGELARALAKRGHRGSYLGLDFSLPLLRDADFPAKEFPATFAQADLTSTSWSVNLQPSTFNLVFSFAVLHHIPGDEIRLNILRTVRELMAEDGRFVLSNWQFLNSEKLKRRIKPWEAAAISPSEVDAGDYLMDWRSGGQGLRYVHHFTAQELSALAEQGGFRVKDSFLSDGDGGNLGLYQIWESA